MKFTELQLMIKSCEVMVQKQKLINLNWKPTQMVVEPKLLSICAIALPNHYRSGRG